MFTVLPTKPPVRAFWITTEHGPPSPRLMLIDKVAIAPVVVIVPSSAPACCRHGAPPVSNPPAKDASDCIVDRPSFGAHVVRRGAVFEAGVHRAGTCPCAADVRKSCGSGRRTRGAVAATSKRTGEQHPEHRSRHPGADGSTRISRSTQFVEYATSSVTLEAKKSNPASRNSSRVP